MRSQQRSISELQIRLISLFGDDYHQSGSCTLSYIPRKRLRELRAALDRLEAVALVKTPGEAIATVMHLHSRAGCTDYVS
jgi:hypothetical protein